MKVSLITISYNSAATIEDTILSVLNQNYQNIEYVIVDGGSTDGTLSIIDKYRPCISIVVSERDNGIYDAMNKGIVLCTGDVIGILNSDDVYFGNDVVKKVADTFLECDTDVVYGDLVYVDRTDIHKITRVWQSGKYCPGLFLKGWMPPHPAFFIKRSQYMKFGLFRTELKISADYELMLRMIHIHQISVSYLPEFITRMRTGGASNVSFSQRLQANREDRKAWRMNGRKPPFLLSLRKPLRKLGQFFRKKI